MAGKLSKDSLLFTLSEATAGISFNGTDLKATTGGEEAALAAMNVKDAVKDTEAVTKKQMDSVSSLVSAADQKATEAKAAADDAQTDATQALSDAARAQSAAEDCVKKAGDTMTGALKVPDGTAAGDAVNKGQLDAVDAKVSALTEGLEAQVNSLIEAYLSAHPVAQYLELSADRTYYKTVGNLPIAVEEEQEEP